MAGLWRRGLSPDQAREIAAAVCRERGWIFLDPVRILPGILSWTIVTNGKNRGAAARVRVSRLSGRVIGAGYVPR